MKFIIEKRVSVAAMKKCDILLLPTTSALLAKLEKVDQALIASVLKAKQLKPGETKFIRLNNFPVCAFLVAAEELNERKFGLLIRQFARVAKAEGCKKIGIYLEDFERANIFAEKSAALIAEHATVAHFDFSEHFKTAPKEGWKFVEEIMIMTYHEMKGIEEAMVNGQMLGEAVNRCRTLSNYPPGDMMPEALVEAARDIAKTSKSLQLTVFDETRLKSEGMNAILAVGKGSVNPPRLIILEYKGGKDGDAPLALVGKGVTFDSGGLNLKPGEGMADMHMDMAGGAAVLCAINAIATLELPVNIIGLVPAVENMPSGLSYRQGDIIKAYGGKTIEIGNTDAEGRVIMADAIEYAKTKKPALILTIATLTGAAVSALGMRASALFVKNNKPLQDVMQELGEVSGDRLWPLPLWDEHEKDVEGTYADVTNTSKGGSRYGWALFAAAFLSHFVKPFPFVHVDMAPRMTTIPDEEFLSKGASGYGVKLVVELAKEWGEIQKTLIKK